MVSGLISKQAILKRIGECQSIGEDRFLQRHGFAKPRGVVLIYKGKEYPARAIWAVAHDPPLDATYDNARMYSDLDAYHRLDSEFYLTTQKEYRESLVDQSAVDDIDSHELENLTPEYQRRMTGFYKRDARVRQAVLGRAAGKCEYDEGCRTFLMPSGQRYLETHHVISLSEQGQDSLLNVIALCPHHHREAHYGGRWEVLQDEFLKLLAKKV